MRCDSLWTDARLLTMADVSVVEHGMIAARDGRILYAGPAEEAPRFDAGRTIRCDGRWITPGLIDCHTHLVHGGDRAHEFELRLAGASYEEIARSLRVSLSKVKTDIFRGREALKRKLSTRGAAEEIRELYTAKSTRESPGSAALRILSQPLTPRAL